MHRNLMVQTRNHECLELRHRICTLPAKTFVNEVIMVETNIIIKGPDLEFGEFLQLLGIYMLMTENSGTNWEDYFSQNHRYFQWVLNLCQQFHVWRSL